MQSAISPRRRSPKKSQSDPGPFKWESNGLAEMPTHLFSFWWAGCVHQRNALIPTIYIYALGYFPAAPTTYAVSGGYQMLIIKHILTTTNQHLNAYLVSICLNIFRITRSLFHLLRGCTCGKDLQDLVYLPATGWSFINCNYNHGGLEHRKKGPAQLKLAAPHHPLGLPRPRSYGFYIHKARCWPYS